MKLFTWIYFVVMANVVLGDDSNKIKCKKDNPRPREISSKSEKPTLPRDRNDAIPSSRSNNPTRSPTGLPSKYLTKSPTLSPSKHPTKSPSVSPSTKPSVSPTGSPSTKPSVSPTGSPSTKPSVSPTGSPSTNPSKSPSNYPTVSPSKDSTIAPTISPLMKSLSKLIESLPRNAPKTDNALSFMTLRIENMNSFIDGKSVMDTNKPNARSISNAFGKGPNSITNSFGATDLMWAFGQFIAHEFSLVNVKAGVTANVEVPPNDPFLDPSVKILAMNRSNSNMDQAGVAQQINNITSVFDAETVYGSTISRLNFIRAQDSSVTGKLRTSGANLLPKNTVGLSNRGGTRRTDLYLGGDIRANENVGLTVTHTLWVREHNYWADNIKASNADLTGDEVFDIARSLVQAEMQKIIFDEFLPALLGEDALPPHVGYKSNTDPGLENVVTACAFRIGHTMVGPELVISYGNGTKDSLALEDAFFAPAQLEKIGGIDPLLRGMANNLCQEVDPFVVSALRNQLFNKQFDLLAINIQRARDHGIPDFNSIRASLGFNKRDSFNDFLFSDELASVYNDTDQIDCWIGMNSEPRLEGLMVGETQRAILARNFANIRDGDINFYRNWISDPRVLSMIEETTYADLIRRNSDFPGSLDDIKDSVFILED